MRLAWHPLWVSGLVVGAGSLVLARNNPAGSFGGQSAVASVALLAAGWVVSGVGLLSWRRRPDSRFGVLLFAAGCAWFVIEWNNPGAGSSPVFTIGLVLYATCPPLLAHAALSYPGGRLGSRLERAAVGAAYAVALVMLGLASALAFAPSEEGCGQCPANLVSVASHPHLVTWLNRNGVRLGVIWTVALALLIAWRLVRATPAARLVKAPVLLPAVAYLGATTVTYAHALDRGFLSNDAFDRQLWLVQAAAMVLLGVGVTEARVRTRRARATVAGLVVELNATPAPGGLGEAVATMLGDPALDVAYPIGDGRHVDSSGNAIDIDDVHGRGTTAILRDGETIAVLIHRLDLLGDRRLVEEVASAARLGFENERLQAETRAQLVEIRTSGARLVAASDAERRRLERDLHDGAQQRLVGLTLALRRIFRQYDPEVSRYVAARVEDAEAELRHAVDELRQLASGIHPAVLTDSGLAAALEALAEDGKVRIRLVAAPDERLPAAVETAAYLVVAEAAEVGPVTVSAIRRSGSLFVDVDAAGEPAGLVNLTDRVGALDGTLGIESISGGGVRIRAEIPCV